MFTEHVQGHRQVLLRQERLRLELAELVPEYPPRALQEEASFLEVLVLQVDPPQLRAQLRDVRVVLANLILQEGEAIRHEGVLIHEPVAHPVVVQGADGPRADRRRIRGGRIAGVEIEMEVLTRVHRASSSARPPN